MTVPRWSLRALLVVGIVAAILWAVLNRDQFDPGALDAWLSGFGVWAPVIYVFLYAAGTVAFLPGSLFALAGGALFGPVWGTALNLLGATMGATAAFLAARYLAHDWATRKAGGGLKRAMAGIDAEGWRFVALVRLVPLFPFNLTNYALGLTRIRLVPYVVTSLICMVPGAAAYTWLGHAGREALTGDSSAIRYGLAALGLLAAIAFLPRLVRRWRKKPIAWIEPADLQRRLAARELTVILDVRNPDEFDGPLGHIAGSQNIPVGDLEARLGELRRGQTGEITVVCRTDKRSAKAAEVLRAAGFPRVAVLRGGMERWNAMGSPSAHGPESVATESEKG